MTTLEPFGGCDCTASLAVCNCAAVAAWQAEAATRNAQPSERSWHCEDILNMVLAAAARWFV